MSGADVLRKYVETFNRQDSAAIAMLYSDDAVVHDPLYPEPLRGRDAVEKDMVEFFRAFPDISAALRTTIENGTTVAGEWAIRGTHEGPLQAPTGEIPATGKVLTFDGAGFYRLDSQGRIVEEHRYFDVAKWMAQLGLTS